MGVLRRLVLGGWFLVEAWARLVPCIGNENLKDED